VNRYHLAKLIEIAGQIDTRKRMQKIVFLLQAAGCPFEADFFLHRFGPYSQDVARLTDELVSAGILEELASENAMGRQFAYKLSRVGEAQLHALEQKPSAHAARKTLDAFADLVRELVIANLRELEVASTIAYCHLASKNWENAKLSGCRYKNVDPDSDFAAKAEALARSVLE
jgi:uncharacterized protein YwgA